MVLPGPLGASGGGPPPAHAGALELAHAGALGRAPAGQPALTGAFEQYYRRQRIAPADELASLLHTLQQPLPLVVRCSRRAPLADRALSRLVELMDDELVEQKRLEWAGSGVWQFRMQQRQGSKYRQFLQQQQMRSALERQEAVSMIPALILAPEPHHAVLDMCAAPGSKSCQLIQMMEAKMRHASEGRGFLMANDASLDRAISLNHRLQSSNVASSMILVSSLDARWWPRMGGLRFDRVLCDVPCSGDGTLRKRHRNTPEWSEATGQSLHKSQVQLLRQVHFASPAKSSGMRGNRVRRSLALSALRCVHDARKHPLLACACYSIPQLTRLPPARGSLNPIENEAVVAEALRQAWRRDGLRFFVENVSELAVGGLAGLHPVPGLLSWLPPGSLANYDISTAPYGTLSTAASGAASTDPPLSASMCPPAPEEVALVDALSRTIRLLPHRDDCGGFFIAAIRCSSSELDTPMEHAERPVALNLAPELGKTVHLGVKQKDGSRATMGEGISMDSLEPITVRDTSQSDAVPVGANSRLEADMLAVLPSEADEWRDICSFYGIEQLDGVLLSSASRSARREKLYLASEGAAATLLHHWKPALYSGGSHRLKGRLHHVGAKAFERLKLTNLKNRDSFTCEWRLCQQALHLVLPRLGKRVLSIADESSFGRALRDGLRNEELHQLHAEGLLHGLSSCTAADGKLLPGGVVLCYIQNASSIMESPANFSKIKATVACVISPSGLTVWAPKEEKLGILNLLGN